MYSLEHRIRVFVFQVLEHGVEFLVLQKRPRNEWPAGPVVGPVEPGEQFQDAVMREVRAETGLRRPVVLREITAPQKELFGEMGVVDWTFAWQAGTPSAPVRSLVPGPMVGDLAWLRFEEAYRRIETAVDREALVRLQLSLQ
jgi:ADP-ribose pyrophosphatase YjhB (NUDIX family)